MGTAGIRQRSPITYQQLVPRPCYKDRSRLGDRHCDAVTSQGEPVKAAQLVPGCRLKAHDQGGPNSNTVGFLASGKFQFGAEKLRTGTLNPTAGIGGAHHIHLSRLRSPAITAVPCGTCGLRATST